MTMVWISDNYYHKILQNLSFTFSKNCTINDWWSTAALIQEWRLFESSAYWTTGKTLRGIWRELSEAGTWYARFRACLHGGGGPQVGEVSCGGSPRLTCKRDHIKMRDYVNRQVIPPERVTSPTWGPPPPCKQALSMKYVHLELLYELGFKSFPTLKL